MTKNNKVASVIQKVQPVLLGSMDGSVSVTDRKSPIIRGDVIAFANSIE